MSRLSQSLLPLLAALFLLPLPAGAVRVEDLYRAEVEVVDKGSEARAQGFRRALEQVLVRVAGDSAVIDDPALESMLATPARFVQQYRYAAIEEPEEPEGGETAGAPATEDADAAAGSGTGEAEPEPAYRLEVRFGQAQIERELRAREVMVWGPYRPQVLVWLAYDDGRRRGLVGADDGTDMDEALRDGAEARGLPLLLPLLDTEDRQRVDFLDVKGGFLDAVRAASERYRAGVVLVGHVYRSGEGWRGEWTLLEGDERRGWLTRAGEAEAAVRTGVDGLADRLAATLAGRDRERRRVRLRVLGPEALADYARLNDYLERLPRIDQRRLVQVRPREVLFELELRGRLADLERAIALDDVLLPEPASTAGSGTAEDAGGDAVSVTAGATEGTPVSGEARPAGAEPGAPDAPDGIGPAQPRDELVYRLAG